MDKIKNDNSTGNKQGGGPRWLNWLQRSWLFLLLGLLLGFSLGEIAMHMDFPGLGFKAGEHPLPALLLAVLLFVVCYFMHIIWHETGHMLCGLLSGYKVMSFRIFSWTLVRENGRLAVKKYAIPGTAGQCLMLPPDQQDGRFPYKLYNLGGILFNALLALAAFLLLRLGQPQGITGSFLLLLAAAGLFCLVTNGIPLKMSGVPNDAYNIVSLHKDALARRSFYVSLKVNGLLTEGVRMREMPPEWFCLPEDADYDNPLVVSLQMMQAMRCHDCLDFGRAEQIYRDICARSHNLAAIFEWEIRCELLFYELVGAARPEVIRRLYDKQLRKYVKSTRCNIGRVKLNYAYALYYQHDAARAEQIYREMAELQRSYPLEGEAIMELEVLNFVRANYQLKKLLSATAQSAIIKTNIQT